MAIDLIYYLSPLTGAGALTAVLRYARLWRRDERESTMFRDAFMETGDATVLDTYAQMVCQRRRLFGRLKWRPVAHASPRLDTRRPPPDPNEE